MEKRIAESNDTLIDGISELTPDQIDTVAGGSLGLVLTFILAFELGRALGMYRLPRSHSHQHQQ
jgi:hypothetical protein